jgi:hypothetical protein
MKKAGKYGTPNEFGEVRYKKNPQPRGCGVFYSRA